MSPTAASSTEAEVAAPVTAPAAAPAAGTAAAAPATATNEQVLEPPKKARKVTLGSLLGSKIK